MHQSTATSTPLHDSAERARWRVAVARAAVAYVISRALVVVGAGIVAADHVVEARQRGDEPPRSAIGPIVEVLTSWDGNWYLRIVRDGYPRFVPAGITYEEPEARAAFFPLYPLVVRWLDRVLPGGDVLAALAVNVALGAAAILLVGLLARQVFGVAVAERSMVLAALFPGSFVLSFSYSEALLLTLAAACLLLLHQGRWWIAGLLAALGTATRPNGVALVVACAVASFVAISDRRDWRSLAAVALSPLGFIGFQWWLGRHASEAGVWLRVQREAWREGTSFGATAMSGVVDFLTAPLSSPTDVLTTATLIALVLMALTAWRCRLPSPWLGYSATVVALMLLPATVTARPRFLYTAFPLLIAVAAWFEQEPPTPADGTIRAVRRDQLWGWTVAACAGGLVALTGLYGVFGAIP